MTQRRHHDAAWLIHVPELNVFGLRINFEALQRQIKIELINTVMALSDKVAFQRKPLPAEDLNQDTFRTYCTLDPHRLLTSR